MQSGRVVEKAGILGWNYNRANYKYDQGLRWQRFTTGRKMAIAQVGMFRQDVTDLATVAVAKMKIYAPILTMSLGYCITIFVEGRSGLKFPGPPVFASGMYLQCLGVAFAFMTLATWLVFHAAIRAQVAATQLRTRLVRVPVPTQKHLDGARRLLSTFEENSLYDMFKVPFVMPNSADPEGHADAAAAEGPAASTEKGGGGKAAGGTGGKQKAKGKAKGGDAEVSPEASAGVRLPGLTKGTPSWLEKEVAARESHPKASPSSHGKDGPTEPFEHFELLRQAQKEYWGAEAYSRVCFLYGMMHLIHSFAYWLVLHNIAELAMVWCANICAAGLCAGVWLMFRMDVLPDYGGAMPVEASGPFVTAVALTMMYTGHYTETVIDISRVVAIVVVVMHILWTFRLYAVAKPTNSIAPSSGAKESGGRLFNESASCELPSWLPHAFQHCTYLVAPPKPKQAVEHEGRTQRPGERPGDVESAEVLRDDPIASVDMTPWLYTRAVLFATLVGWCVLLTGRIIELSMGERMLVTNPGAPPWTRTGQWYGWEHGPITSKHYAHVTPQRGHFAWQKGWGPQGQQELWASDMFGFAPEADAWWAEDEGPEPRVGAAGIGENTWAAGLIAYGTNELPHGQSHDKPHDWLDSGGHRRLRAAEGAARPVVPLAVQWPAALEPDLLACGPGTAAGAPVLALSLGGLGAVVPPGVAAGRAAGGAAALVLKGLLELGMARGVTWGNTSLLVVTGSGTVAACPGVGPKGGALHCSPWTSVPKLPLGSAPGGAPALAALLEGEPLRAAVTSGARISLLELRAARAPAAWHATGELELPGGRPLALSATGGRLLVLADDGAAYHWTLRGSEPQHGPLLEVPAAGPSRAWRSACALPDGRVMRLATGWRRAPGGASAWHPELLL